MAEFVVEYPDDLVAEGYVETFVNVYESIVRCRDCKFSRRNGTICRHKRFTMRETEFDMVYVEPYGFCYWGKKREAGE